MSLQQFVQIRPGSRRVRARRTGAALTLSLMACAGLSIDAPRAQTTPEALPPVVVKAPKKQTIRAKRTKAPAASAVAAQPVPLTDTEPRPKTETATGPVEGIVATRSATGTKTDTPLLETPQSISVITADRVHQQAATSVSDALGYTAGVRANVYGDDTRFDWLSIRGFDAYLPGFFVDGMLARNNNTWSVWKVEPYGQERIEVLKGPPSVLYGQANVGGMVNVISKRPLDEPFNEVRVRAGNNKRIEGAFDFSGPATNDGTFLYRLTGLLLDTDTQVDFTSQERIYIAPAVTWRPSTSTSLTLLGQYLKEDDVPNNRFLPPQGIVLPNQNGRIPRDFFTGEPGYDKFVQEQWAIGYLFQHRFDRVWQVRQNLRYREVDVDYKTVYGTGLDAGDPTQRTLTRGVFTSFEKMQAFTVDNQVQADFTTGAIKHTMLAGVDYQNNVFDQRAGIGAGPSIDMYDPSMERRPSPIRHSMPMPRRRSLKPGSTCRSRPRSSIAGSSRWVDVTTWQRTTPKTGLRVRTRKERTRRSPGKEPSSISRPVALRPISAIQSRFSPPPPSTPTPTSPSHRKPASNTRSASSISRRA
jgi:iron complex outermembrane receptor protein